MGVPNRPHAGPSAAALPDARLIPSKPVTRFAPAPTGFLHLGHLVNALYTWGVARAAGGRVVLRIEDHDRQRSRPEYEAALLDDLEALGLAPDTPPLDALRAGRSPFRQSDSNEPYEASLARLRDAGIVYACECARSTFAAYEAAAGRRWHGIGCPGRCRGRGLAEAPGRSIRMALGAGSESWVDLLVGPVSDEPAADGDPIARDRHGNWTYGFCVVLDDMRHGIDLVIRGRDLLHATAAQIRLARLLGRDRPPRFLHHPLVRRASGAKLSKADRDTSVRSLLAGGRTRAELFGIAAHLAGLTPDEEPLEPAELGRLFG